MREGRGRGGRGGEEEGWEGKRRDGMGGEEEGGKGKMGVEGLVVIMEHFCCAVSYNLHHC